MNRQRRFRLEHTSFDDLAFVLMIYFILAATATVQDQTSVRSQTLVEVSDSLTPVQERASLDLTISKAGEVTLSSGARGRLLALSVEETHTPELPARLVERLSALRMDEGQINVFVHPEATFEVTGRVQAGLARYDAGGSEPLAVEWRFKKVQR